MFSAARRKPPRSFSRNEPDGGARSIRVAHASGDVVEAARPERHGHAPLRAELIGQDRETRALDVGKEQRRAARFYDAVGNRADLETRIDAGGDHVELAGLAQRFDELPQGGKRHGLVSYALRRANAYGTSSATRCACAGIAATKRAPPAAARADRHGTVVGARDPAHDCQAQSGSGAVVAAAIEALEDALAFFGRDAVAVVFDDDLAVTAIAPRSDADPVPRVTQRVVEQVARQLR